MKPMRLRALLLLFSWGVVMALAAACDKIQPVGSSLVRGVPPPPPPPPPEDASQPLLDSGLTGDGPVYEKFDADLTACSMCTCEQATSFCFAGATPRAPVDAGEGGVPPCTVASGPTPEIGCNAMPAECAATPTCGCILAALQPKYRCYLNCADDGSQFLVYCPN
jgi:hypothetical protein